MLSAEETDPLLEPLSADTLLPDVPWKLCFVTTLFTGDDSDPPRGLPGALFTPATPAVAETDLSTAAAASNQPPPAEEETELLGPSPRRRVMLLCILLSVQSPLTRRALPQALLVERRPRSARSKGLSSVSTLSTPCDVEPGEADSSICCCGDGGDCGGLSRPEAALDLASGPRMLLTPKRSPLTAGSRDFAIEPRMVASIPGLQSSTFANGFADDDGGDKDDGSV